MIKTYIHNIYLIFILLVCIGCSKNPTTYLNSEFDCSSSEYKTNDLEEVIDIKKNFIMKIPETWKTNLYYSDYESEIFSADTTKSLTNTFILDVSMVNGNLKMDQDSESLVINKYVQEEGLELISSGRGDFQGKKSFWFLAEGSRRDYKYTNYLVFVKNSERKYLKMKTEMFGGTGIDNKICNSIELINQIKILDNY
ncbi:hypothetical protein [Aureivirga marina]|uniref:hypothetical protein n=1 Tax=Aureivirga marina TaxID=1182451 RepID=UPI0018CBD29C|nr:hypothetical protein [Aureivirga marina]